VLIAHGAPLSPQNLVTSATPLHCAVQSLKLPASNRAVCVKLLLDAGADPNIPDNYGTLPHEYANESGESGIELLLLRCVPKIELFSLISECDICAIRDVLETDEKGLIRFIRPEKNREGNTYISHAIQLLTEADKNKEDLLKIIKLLLQSRRVDINLTRNEDDSAPIHQLCIAIKLLFSKSTSNIGNTAADDDTRFLKQAVTLLISDERTHIPKETIYLLHDASRRNNVRFILYLINDVGVDVNHKGRQGLTPLHFAARSGHVDAAETLLNSGADLNYKDDRGKTPMDAAGVNGKEDVIKLLVKWNNEKDEMDEVGTSKFAEKL